MKIVSPPDFAHAFLREVVCVEGSLLEMWTNPCAYTLVMRSTILPHVASRLGLASYCSRDYYGLDGILYEELDQQHFPLNSYYAKFLSVELEHENLPEGSAIEMNKLQIFNAPLKVLITYPRGKCTMKYLLERYARIFNWSDWANDTVTLRRQLVVFGQKASNSIQVDVLRLECWWVR